MANDKKNINELVADDEDPTAELEVLALHLSDVHVELEAAASTAGFRNGHEDFVEDDAAVSDLQSDLKARTKTIDRLQFDMTQLRAKWLGLETEIQEREKITRQLNAELLEAGIALRRKKNLVRKRDRKIKALKSEIRERNDAYRILQEDVESLNRHVAASTGDDTQQNEQILVMQAGQIASHEKSIRDLQDRNARLEEYADTLRQQIQDRDAETDNDEHTREYLQDRLQDANTEISSLEDELTEIKTNNESLSAQLSSLNDAHADEIRTIRFELGQAQETVSQHELVAEQLASDLVDTRTYRVELESMLNESEESNKQKIESLEKENRNLRRESRDQQQKLDTKSEAINCLLAELSKKTQQIESISEIEDVIHEIDDRMSERIEDNVPSGKERVTRVLIGSIDDQELRFPLFKDRLTIGRTEQNDIQLKASFISRRHAVIATEGRATRVIDWGSKNGVYVNSKRVTEHFLKNGDVVTIGTADFHYEERPKRDG
ncbi:MAG: FHA domain-containing protein [Woeseiaceae bacterium]